MRFIDTNVFVRALSSDDPAKSAKCRGLFERVAAGQDEVATSETVLSEIVYVLSSPKLYGMAHDEIAARLITIFSLSALQIPAKAACLRALDLYSTYSFLSIEDALSAAHMERQAITEIVSYDRDFDRVPGIRRSEP